MDEIKAKQQVVEKIREAENILVTVSDSPSVDALSAALGLALLLDGQGKYPTAIFSGQTPPAIAFLEPEKTFDDTTDSLRDFIIALNKEKADHLRYKVEGDSVRIFITPYKAVITEADLEYSQGDYNVDLVIALGVDSQENLDEALDNHGKILHDAAIVTITAGEQTSDLGGVDWHEGGASSLSEMVTGLAEALKTDKKKQLLNGQIATALLTGIVAETDRFSNEHTTSKAMTVAATLMAAGADQQLIATELQNAQESDDYTSNTSVSSDSDDADDDTDNETTFDTADGDRPNDTTDDDNDSNSTDSGDGSSVSADGTMTITEHKSKDGLKIDHAETLAELDERVLGEDAAQDKIEEEREILEHERVEVAEDLAARNAALKIQRDKDALKDIIAYNAANGAANALANEAPVSAAYSAAPEDAEPSFGGTLNATTEEAEEYARHEAMNEQNKTILSHSYLGGAPSATANQSVSAVAADEPKAPGSIGFDEMGANEAAAASLDGNSTPNAQSYIGTGEHVVQPLGDHAVPSAAPTAAQSVLPPLASDLAANEPSSASVATAYSVAAPSLSDSLASTVQAAPLAPADLGLPLPPPLPDFSQGIPPAIPPPQTQRPAILGDILAQEPGEVVVDPTANAIAAAGTAYAFEETPISGLASSPVAAPLQAPVQANPADPAQYQIPTQ